MATINKTISTPIGMAPDDVDDSNQIQVWKRLWGDHLKRMERPRPPAKFKPSDLVRISSNKVLFQKGTTKSNSIMFLVLSQFILFAQVMTRIIPISSL